MIERIKLIANVGRFLHAKGEHNDLRFDPLTLVYGENSQGKTTMTAVFWSLATGDAAFLAERKRLGASGEQKVMINVDGHTAVFDGTKWTKPFPNIHIYDDHFIEMNVASHRTTSLDQRRELLSVILGDEGRLLKERVNTLTEEIRTLTSEAKEAETTLRPHIQGNTTATSFCELLPEADVDALITKRESELAAAKAADRIKTGEVFTRFQLPKLRLGTIRRLLSSSLTDINREAESRVKEHIAGLGNGAEDWIGKGLAYPHEKTCPFCTQETEGVQIIRDFKAYFSQAYLRLKSAISEVIDKVELAMSGDELAKVVKRIGEEEQKRQLWSQFTSLPDGPFPIDVIEDAWIASRNTLLARLKDKATNPLECQFLTDADRESAKGFITVARTVHRTCADLQKSIAAIKTIQEAAATANVVLAAGALDLAKNTKTRHNSDVSKICEKYTNAVAAKEKKRAQKDEAVDNLSANSEKLLKTFGKAINGCLENFGAGFRIEEMKESREAGAPGCIYGITVDGYSIPLADPKKPGRGAVTSRTALSAGDRSALAFAFFLVKLLERASLAGEVVILDDPVCSMDLHRKERTADYIRQLINQGAQVVVLSHNAQFLRHLWLVTRDLDVNFIKIEPSANESTFKPWEISEDTDSEYQKLWLRLARYISDPKGNPDDVRHCIRRLLEGYLRHQFPAVTEASDTLGGFITKARSARNDETPLLSDSRFQDLEELNRFSTVKAHLSDSGSSPGPASVTAVQTYAKQALRFVEPPRPLSTCQNVRQ